MLPPLKSQPWIRKSQRAGFCTVVSTVSMVPARMAFQLRGPALHVLMWSNRSRGSEEKARTSASTSVSALGPWVTVMALWARGKQSGALRQRQEPSHGCLARGSVEAAPPRGFFASVQEYKARPGRSGSSLRLRVGDTSKVFLPFVHHWGGNRGSATGLVAS